MKKISIALITALVFGGAIWSKYSKENVVKAAKVPHNALSLAPPNPTRDAFYGELHLHTNQSFDAYTFGTRLTPEDAHKYAKGEAIELLGEQVKRNFPLDFQAVTDHSENMGVLTDTEDPSSLLYSTELGEKLRVKSPDIYQTIRTYFFLDDYKSVANGYDNKAKALSAWNKQIEAAHKFNQPGKYTTFAGYEWTSAPDRQNLHRVVIFKGNNVAKTPFSSIDSKRPEDLWSYLENQRQQGNEGLAIPHNGNASNGLMYDWNDSDGKPIDQSYALRRSLNEPLSEISQNKGTSETHPSLSPTDEFANFEIADFMSPRPDSTRKASGSYIRDAYGRGLVIKEKIGENPFKFGVVGASDLHGAQSISSEKDYVGSIAAVKTDPAKTLKVSKEAGLKMLFYGSGNITGVWAEENTRNSIYDAFRRKETFATTGTRLKFRFFGGWNFPTEALKDKNWVKTAYSAGAPMGGDLPANSGKAKAPSFLIWAIKDPNSANLDRVQVIKVWAKGGKNYEKIFDVALADHRKPDASGKVKPVGNTVDLKTATYQNTIGDTELSTTWTDPEFDPTIPASYYIRVLEIPTPRWSTYLAVKNNLPLPSEVPAVIQERGWSSPIWYTPSK
jgi:hypothetical protein